MMSLSFSASGAELAKTTRAEWLEGGWGVRIVLPGGDRPEVEAFDVRAFADQVRNLDSISWVMINVTQAACGSLYTAPHPFLEKEIHSAMAPSRDLLGEMIKALKKNDLKVLVYYASEGPAKVKSWTHHLEYTVSGSFEKWAQYCESQNMSSKEVIAEKIIKYYSLKYGAGIDGWWFDHAIHGDTTLFANAARAGNSNAVVSFNLHSQGKVVRSDGNEDVAFGHPLPLVKQPANWEGNTSMINTIEEGPYVDGSLGHMFLPMQSGWWKGEAVFTTDMAVDWTLRVVKAKGSFTWAVALDFEKGNPSVLAETQFKQLQEINRQINQLKN